MVNIKDADAAQKIITLERELGWPEDGEGKLWAEGLTRDIADIQRGTMTKIAEAGNSGQYTIRRGEVFYGQGGYDRFRIANQMPGIEDGELLFILIQCSYTKEEIGRALAQKHGFTIV
jgi:hypothetical protein